MNKTVELPEEYKNVMITYNGPVFVRDGGYGHYVNQIVTRRAFYSKSDGYYNRKDEWIETPNGKFSVPQEWKVFEYINGTKVFAPHTFRSYPPVFPEDIIKWEYDTNTNH